MVLRAWDPPLGIIPAESPVSMKKFWCQMWDKQEPLIFWTHDGNIFLWKNKNFSQTGPWPWLILDRGDFSVVMAGGPQIMTEFLGQWRELVGCGDVAQLGHIPSPSIPGRGPCFFPPFLFLFFKGFLINFLFQWWDNEF